MFNFFKRNTSPSDSDFVPSVMHSAANSSQGAGDIQRELVRVAFNDTLLATGVPSQWLDCEVHFIQSAQYGERVLVQLVVKKWSGLLLRHSLAFQHVLARCLDRYEPHIDHSRHEWTWKFAADCATPFPDMPAPEEWEAKLRVSLGQAAAATGNAAQVTPRVVAAVAKPQDRAFEMRDIFSDLTADKLRAK